MTDSAEYFPIAAGGRWARLIFSNTSPMPPDGVVEKPADTARRLATRLQHLVPAVIYAELVRLLIADVVEAKLNQLVAEPAANPIEAAAGLLWEYNNPDLPNWHELDEGTRADYRAFLERYEHYVAQEPDTVRRGRCRVTKKIDRGDHGGTSGDDD